MKALQTASNYFGSQRKLALALGVHPMAVSQWKRRGIPIHRAIQIERITGGAVTCGDLRPDIFGADKQAA